MSAYGLHIRCISCTQYIPRCPYRIDRDTREEEQGPGDPRLRQTDIGLPVLSRGPKWRSCVSTCETYHGTSGGL